MLSVYLTWAFFSVIAVYMTWITLDVQREKHLSKGPVRALAWGISILFLVIYLINRFAIKNLFTKPLGEAGASILIMAITLMIVINVYPVLSGVMVGMKQKKRERITIHR
ncbi:hypothetical protein QG40_23990 [Salmonella enterica subsp. enterica]|nr:hypothetical protein [Salmonella enterica subsp. enterica serovar Newport]EBZ2758175.1 hypothetical protein [Salmonella enterica subsp. enterica serovar Pomona]ECH8956779.1 hypothetical protein [Salmonella enterica subsp. enterica serovar Hvittingfoss]ECJ4059538.1 hypothetical protein [Salmonella enterica subsp. enterica serovar Hvittingfoss]